MSKADLTSLEWCELIFQDRNKSYGAYKMRQDLGKRQTAALSGTDFACIEDLQIDFLAVIVCIGRVVAFDAYLSAINKHIHSVWAVAQIHLIDDLAHLACGKRIIAQFIDVPVVVKENLGPVLNQIFFCGLYEDFLFPTMMGEKVNQGLFKLTFLDEILYVVYIIHIYSIKGLNEIFIQTFYPNMLP